MFRLGAASLLLGASGALAASAPVAPASAPVDVELDRARAEAAAAQAEQRRLEAAAQSARDEASRLRARQLAAAQAIAAAEAQISAADAYARVVQAQLLQQRQRLTREQAPVSSLLTALALTARKPPILVLADSGSADALVKLRLLIAATRPVIQAKTAALARELDRGSRLEQAALAARDEMRRSRSELSRRRDAFAQLEARANRLAESRRADALGAGDVALARSEQLLVLERQAQSRRSAARLATALAELGPAPLPTSEPGASPVPLRYVLPSDAAVVTGVGSVSASGVRSRGLTLSTRRGSPLVVPAGGTILFAGPFRDYDGVVVIDHGRGWKSVLVNAGSTLARGATVRIGDPLGIALGPIEVQLQHRGEEVSPALIAGSYQMLSNERQSG